MRIVYKQKGETPLEAIERFRADRAPEFDGVTLSYAGRLDPMAEGVLLILVGEENNDREKYLHLDKEYELEILFGVESDTYDVLGKVWVGSPEKIVSADLSLAISDFMRRITTEYIQEYPPYSSKPVKGKPLFSWAREGRLDEIVIPNKKVRIYAWEVLDIRTMPVKEVVETILHDIQKVKGDFRQELAIESWRYIAKKYPFPDFHIARVRISCQSGTYMRTIVYDLGTHFSSGALALGIKRIRVGEHCL